MNFQANGSAVANPESFHYYPFGMQMEGIGTALVTGSNKYRYNGKEINDEFGVNLSDYGARWYDAALGRWWSTEPLSYAFTEQSLYLYGANNPVSYIDLAGLLQFPSGQTINIGGVEKTYEAAFPLLTQYLKGVTINGETFGLASFISGSNSITSALKVIGGYNDETIKSVISTFGTGAIINVNDMGNNSKGPEKNGEQVDAISTGGFRNSPGSFNIDLNLVLQFENSTSENREAALLALISTILHESIHVGYNSFLPVGSDLKDGAFERKKTKDGIIFLHNGVEQGDQDSEKGKLFERLIWHGGDFFHFDNNRKQPINGGIGYQKEIIDTIKPKTPNDIPKPVPVAAKN